MNKPSKNPTQYRALNGASEITLWDNEIGVCV
jgi:hypothetical protein